MYSARERIVEVFEPFERADSRIDIESRLGAIAPSFVVLLLRGPLESGDWSIVRKARTKLEDRSLSMFEQNDTRFRLRKGGLGMDVSVRDCLGLEKDLYWHANDVVERLMNGMNSEKLQKHWPLCVSADGSLRPKWWNEWSPEDLEEIESAQRDILKTWRERESAVLERWIRKLNE